MSRNEIQIAYSEARMVDKDRCASVIKSFGGASGLPLDVPANKQAACVAALKKLAAEGVPGHGNTRTMNASGFPMPSASDDASTAADDTGLTFDSIREAGFKRMANPPAGRRLGDGK